MTTILYALLVLGVIIAVQQLEGNVLQPWLQSKSMKLHAVIVLPVKGQGEQMDYAVMTACNLRSRLGRYTPIVLADCGLDETGRQRAEFLTQNNNCVTVLLPSQLEDYIT